MAATVFNYRAASSPDFFDNNHHIPLLGQGREPILHFVKHAALRITLGLIFLAGLVVGIWLFVEKPGRYIITPDVDANLHLVSRGDWGEMPSEKRNQDSKSVNPATHAVILHTFTNGCSTRNRCAKAVKSLHMIKNDSDISYSFLIGGDGMTYEGSGWDTERNFSYLLNQRALGIALIGDFRVVVPSKLQMDQLHALLEESVFRGKLLNDYKLVAQSQIADTESPGEMVYNIIRNWPNWKDCKYEMC